MLIRPVEMDDVDALVELVKQVDGLLTTLPKNAEQFKERIDWSKESFARDVTEPGDEAYLFILEDEGKVVGLSALYATVGLDRPFYNYRVSKLAKKAPDLDIQVHTDVLHLVNDYTGACELGTLFLAPEARGGGRGRLLSYARFLYIAANRARFPERLFAEIRGWTDEAHNSPFWDAVGRRFFNLEYSDADALSGQDYRFISDLMPTHPVYTALLPEDAQEVIAKPAEGAQGAYQLLRDQGMRHTGMIDIFDAGPCLNAMTDEVEIVRRAQHFHVEEMTGHWGAGKYLVANARNNRFRATITSAVAFRDNRVAMAPQLMKDLCLEAGDHVIIYLLG